ncbi:MAG: glycerol-3-phosphate 1-O-acyltransferase PlsY [Nitrospirota bacterium]|nr:glycerol-3-phosphate 1-O-acyltransferase PlsY [Nitrospirota bacterium]
MSVMDIALVVVAYLVGAVPFGVLVARMLGIHDLQSRGSGNIGATNVNRILGKKAGAITLLCDVLKGFLPVWAGQLLGATAEVQTLVAAAAVVGHIFPIYLRFRGGKGVATGFGVVMALHPPTAIAALVIWLGTARISRVSAVGALSAYALLPLLAWGMGPGGWFVPFVVGLSVLVLVRHTSNIRQLIAERRG